MKYEIELHEEEIQNLKRIRNYFGEHDKTMLEHMGYALLDKLVKNLTIPVVINCQTCCFEEYLPSQDPCTNCIEFNNHEPKDG